ncbi:cell cycle checkpoint protein RAD17 [Podospora fimiseda]|uniref:Cell cycle checkpoint protein RAD17 n=1 Tax=Podospora fimiseda TaxID=252190 RepID=A0AAN7BWW2_9PEZI|nr:cell cycle checkpoint protein RAD17 [Podospora fimiseda]
MASLLSYVPVVGRFLAGQAVKSIDLPSVEVHSVETDPEKRPRTLKHLLKANHINHSIIYHNLQFDNHMSHILCSAYVLGADSKQLYHIYDEEAKQLEPWKDSPSELLDEDWRDFLGDKRYQRAFVDFFEDALAMKHAYNWRGVVEEYMFKGDEPLINCLIGGLGHPLIQLGYAYEFDSREMAIEALALSASQYNYLHKYTDDPAYTEKAPFSSTSPTELLNKLASDTRFDKLFKSPGFQNIDPLFEKHESLVLEYWNAWEIRSDPVKQFQESQEAAVALLVATVAPGTHAYNFFLCHVLTTSHAARILFPFLPPKYHIPLVRQWWLLTLAVYIAVLRPKIDPDFVPGDLKGKGWKYVQDKALTGPWNTDAHYVKAIRSIQEMSKTWGDVHERYLAAAVRFADDFSGSLTQQATWNPTIAPFSRMKRAVIDDSDDDDYTEQQQKQPAKRTRSSKSINHTNNLDSFVISSSPDPKRVVPTKAPTASPSPIRRRATTTRSVKAPPAKSPSASPVKRTSEEKTKSGDLRTLFSRQAAATQKNNTANSQTGTASTYSSADLKRDALLLLDDILSDPIDDFDDEDDIPLSKTSSVAQKRVKENGNGVPQGSSSVMLNGGGGGKFLRQKSIIPPTEDENDARPWSERFAPVNLDELAVHKRKVADIRKWLDDVYAGRLRQRLLVLKGAAGTGKTTTVRLLAKELGCDVLEWRNPTTNSFGMPGQAYQSAAGQFEEFLGRGGKFGQLDIKGDEEQEEEELPTPVITRSGSGSEKRMILVEEFPNTFARSSTALLSFRNSILQYLAANMPPSISRGNREPATPIVMVVSETLLTTASASADSFTAHRLLGPEILKHPGTGVIEFNPIAPTLLAKALELIVQKEARKSGRRRTPGPLVLQRLGEIGDIRSAISSLEFLCVKGDNDADWGSKVAFTKPKRGSRDVPPLTKDEQKSLELVSQRESTLGLFHAIGKVVYNKRDSSPSAGTPEAAVETLPDFMTHLARPRPSEVSVDTLMDETGTDTQTFISALHENYPLSCEQSGPRDQNSSIDYINGCLDYLSESDLLCPSWDIFFGGSNGSGGGGSYLGKDSGSHILRQDEMAFQVAVRGMLFSLPYPVKRQKHPTGRAGGGNDAYKMFYPTYLKLWRTKEELEGLTDMWATKMLKGEFITTTLPPSPPTSGALMFARKGGGLSPSKTKTINQRQQASANPPPPLLSLGSAARQELVLERLPYMAHIARHRQTTQDTTKDLERIVSFRGIGAIGNGEDDDDNNNDDEDDTFAKDAAKSWATDRPTEEATPKKKRGAGVGRGLGAIFHGGTNKPEEELEPPTMQSLFISDDDIED